MTTPDIHPIFADCVGDHGRYKLDQPWVKDGWRYATDGRIVVRERCEEPDTAAKKEHPFPNGDDLFRFGKEFNKRSTRIPKIHYDDEPVMPVVLRLRDNYAIGHTYLSLLFSHKAKLYLPESLLKSEVSMLFPARFTVGKTIEGRVMPMKTGRC